MNDAKLKNLLKQADKNAKQPEFVNVDIEAIYQQAKHRTIIHILYPAAAAAVMILAVLLWSAQNIKTKPSSEPIDMAASIEMQIEQFQISTDITVNLINETLQQQDSQKTLEQLKAELESIPDSIEEINQELDRTAFILVYSADRMYNELNLTDSAVETYKRVINLFPENQWAQVARERLEKINKRNNNDSSKGDIKWQEQNTLS